MNLWKSTNKEIREMERVYRIELRYSNGSHNLGTVFSSLDAIKKSLEGNLLNHPTVYVYTKCGKNPVMVFEG